MTKKTTFGAPQNIGKKVPKTGSTAEQKVRDAHELEIKRLVPLARVGSAGAREALKELLSEQGRLFLHAKWGQTRQRFCDAALFHFFEQDRRYKKTPKFESWLEDIDPESNILAQFNTALLNFTKTFHESLKPFLLHGSEASSKSELTQAQAMALTKITDELDYPGRQDARARTSGEGLRPIVETDVPDEISECSLSDLLTASKTGQLFTQLISETSPENPQWQAVLRRCHWLHIQTLEKLLRESPCQPFATFAEHPALLRYRHWHGLCD